MKRLWIAVALLVAAALLCVSVTIYQHHHIDRMLSQLDRLEQAYNDRQYDTALTIAGDMAEHYKQVGRILFCFVTHKEMADSQETVALLPYLLEYGGKEELYMEIARLREQLLYLRGVDDLKWENVL